MSHCWLKVNRLMGRLVYFVLWLVRLILHGNEFMAHKHGFTSESLLYYLKKANFKSFCIAEAIDAYALWLIAYKGIMKEDSVLEAELKSHIIPRNQYE